MAQSGAFSISLLPKLQHQPLRLQLQRLQPKATQSRSPTHPPRLMVPLTRKNLQINLFKKWKIPVILCARTGLGTINHTLLSLEAIWSRRIPLKGIAFIGDENEDNMRTIKEFSNVKILGRLPMMELLSDQSLKAAFQENFKIDDFI